MGLDMFLTARRSFWDFLDDGVGARKVMALFPELPEDTDTSGTAVSVKFGYWRKANAIHNWFVQNVQGGEDNCQEFWVSPEDLQKLLDTVNDVLADMSKAPELLPPREGFFFGGTDIDEWYWCDVEYTKELLEKALDSGMKDWEFYYQSSW